jgi:hypothetical protein
VTKTSGRLLGNIQKYNARNRLTVRGKSGRIVPYDSSLWPRYSVGCCQIINIPVSGIPTLKENLSNTQGLQADVDGVEEWDECFGLVYGGPGRTEGNSTADRREDASSAVNSSIHGTSVASV